MRSLILAATAAVTLLLVGCMYQRDFGTETVRITEYPDGTRTMTIERDNGSEKIEMDITGKSRREVRRVIPFPLLEDLDGLPLAANPVPVPIDYRYEYRFDVYDINGDFVDTITIETYDDFVAMMPVAFSLGGFPMPSQETLDALAADLLLHWVDPETDWHNHN